MPHARTLTAITTLALLALGSLGALGPDLIGDTMSHAEARMPTPSHDQATIIAAGMGAAVTVMLGWLTGGWHWLFSWRGRRQDSLEKLLENQAREIERVTAESRRQAADADRRNTESDRQSAELAVVKEQVRKLDEARVNDARELHDKYALLLSEAEAKHVAEHTADVAILNAARLEHEAVLRAVTTRFTQQVEEADERASAAEREAAALRDEMRRVREELKQALASKAPGVRGGPQTGPIC